MMHQCKDAVISYFDNMMHRFKAAMTVQYMIHQSKCAVIRYGTVYDASVQDAVVS